MSRRRTRVPLLSALLAAILALPVVMASASDAHADRYRVRFGGRARVRIGGPSVRVRYGGPRVYSPGVRVRYRPYYRPYRPRYRYWTVGGSIYYGSAVYYADPPPPPPPRCYDSCGGVAVYNTPAPIAPVYVRPLPRLGIGVFAGSMNVEDQEIGSDVGLLGRLRLTDHFQLEGEFAKSEIADSTRVDRRLGAALMYDFNPRGTFSPFVLAGLGVSQTEIGDDEFSTEQGYGELGIGLTWNLTRHLAISGDLRAGQRETTGDDVSLLATMPQPVIGEEESFTRARLSAILFF